MNQAAPTGAAQLHVLIDGKVVEFDQPVPTAKAAAEVLGCEVGAIANSLIFDADGEPVLVLTSGAHRVNPERVAALLAVGSLKRASREFVERATGQPVGGVAPVGHPTPLRTVVDVWLQRYDVLWAGAGTKHSMFPTSFDELLRLTDGLAADVGD
ncbi:MAG: YbaK/EbsC family protein [Micromonosporaceae bacterium]